jgi:8-oxo-dGTP diphosphatase
MCGGADQDGDRDAGQGGDQGAGPGGHDVGEDGDGWVRCDLGHRHWGRFGAAGLLGYTRDETGRASVLLQHRSPVSSHGGTWGLFGGARRSREPADVAALREAGEECTLPTDLVRIQGILRDDHGHWAYESVIGELPRPVPVRPANWETAEAKWVAVGAVEQLRLHPGFAAFWPVLRGALLPLVIIVDAANVMGARADGWWRDRARAAARLRDELSSLGARGIRSVPAGMAVPPLDVWFPEIVMVVEGAARAGVASAVVSDAGDPRASGGDDPGSSGPAMSRSGSGGTRDGPSRVVGPGAVRGGAHGGVRGAVRGGVRGAVRIVAAKGSGDDAIADLAGDARGFRLVVTADRELRRRCESAGAAVVGPRWLLGLL